MIINTIVIVKVLVHLVNMLPEIKGLMKMSFNKSDSNLYQTSCDFYSKSGHIRTYVCACICIHVYIVYKFSRNVNFIDDIN